MLHFSPTDIYAHAFVLFFFLYLCWMKNVKWLANFDLIQNISIISMDFIYVSLQLPPPPATSTHILSFMRISYFFLSSFHQCTFLYSIHANCSNTYKASFMLLCLKHFNTFYLFVVSSTKKIKIKKITRRTEVRSNEMKWKREKNNNKWKSCTVIIIKCNLICFYQIIQKRLKLLLLVSNLSWHGNQVTM